MVEQLRRNYPGVPHVLLDSGNFFDNPTPAGDLKTQALAEAMSRMQYAAVNVGERELMMGYDEFVRKTAVATFPFVSTNLVRQDTKEPVFRPWVIAEAPRPGGEAPLRIGILGVMRFNPLFLKAGPQKTNLVIAPPREMLKRFLPEVRRRSDVVVLLAALHHDDARLLARDLEGIDFVLGAYGGHLTQAEVVENGARVVYVSNQGKGLGETRVVLGGGTKIAASVSYVHLMTARYPDDERMLQFTNDVRSRLNQRRAAEQEKSRAALQAAATTPYLGPDGCRSCHAAEHADWTASAHARAYATLVDKGQAANLVCLPCHVTGAPESGGFRDLNATPGLAAVGCESCHGPGAAHAAEPKSAYGAIEVARCIGCHNRQNSPSFDYYTYLPRVSHRRGPGD